MSLPLVFKPAARTELVEAIAWYDSERPGLGREFAMEVKAALVRAQANPDLFRKVRGRPRKIHLRRFTKYSIYFAIKDNSFAVLSVFHGARNPAGVKQRLK